jgi:hypothetical protein
MRVFRFLPIMLLAVLGAAPAAQASHSHDADVQVIASGLDSPRHLAFGSGGDLFVAEAGRGGSGPCFLGGEGPACMGASGAVTKLDRWGHQSRIAEGLASYANTPGNNNAIGPHGIMVLGRHTVVITNGGPTEPKELPTTPDGTPGPTISRDTLAAENPVADLFGRVLLLRRHRDPISIADIWAFERDNNPDATVGNPAIDSNPVDVKLDGRRLVVADAGGNAIDLVRGWGRVSNLAVFPNKDTPNPFGGPDIPMQAVPTSVAVGRDAYYVSQLTGFPFPVGAANIYRVDKRTGEVSVFASGFTNLMDLAWGRDGTLYALEIAHNGLLSVGSPEGAIFAVSPDGSSRQLDLPAGTLTAPGGIAVGRHALYVTNNSVSPGGGQVLRISTR